MDPRYVKRSRAVTWREKIPASGLSAILYVLSTAALFGCFDPDDGIAGTAVFDLPRDGTDSGFFDLPWPNDLRRTEDGHVDVRDFPNPMNVAVLESYIDAISTRLDGFGTNGAVYFRFSRTVDTESLPSDPATTVSEEASVFLIDVDPDSPTRGARHPAVVVYNDAATQFWPEHTIAIRPVYGIPLAGGRTYAAVVTNAVTPADEGIFQPSLDFQQILQGGGDAAVETARAIYDPALAVVEESGVSRDAIVTMAVFTTHDPTAELIAIRDWMIESYTEPTWIADSGRWLRMEESHHVIHGRYGPVPLFQSGEPPYIPSGGEIVFEGDAPSVAAEIEVPFALTVPVTPMPPDGYPIVLYAHGTGGDFETFIRNGVADDLAREGYAVIGIDQVLHGERNPTTEDPAYLFFNFENPYAARNNVRQAALEVVQQARFAATTVVPDRVLLAGGQPVRFDPNRIYVYGHSQGGLNMPLFLAIDDQAQGGMLSGAGATLAISIIEKKQPIDILLAVKLFLRLSGSTTEAAVMRENFVYEHPVLSVLQAWVDAGDAANYAHMIFHEPRPGFAPKSVLQSEGLTDLYTTPHNIEALAGAAHIPQVEPVEVLIESLVLRGIPPMAPPVRGNVAGGAATAGLLQFAGDGHFVAFDNDVLRGQIRGFFRTFTPGELPEIPAP